MTKTKTIKIITGLLAVLLLLHHGTVMTVYAEENPDNTEEYLLDDSANESDSVTITEQYDNPDDGNNALGYIEEDIDKERLLHHNASPHGTDTLPSSYSLLSKGYVTDVKNQNPYGTCWTFATVGSAESGIKKKYGETVDLAELQLAYFFYNCYQKPDPMKLIVNDGNYTNDSNVLDIGGNSIYTTYALASGIGFTDEEEYSYSDAASYLTYGPNKECYNTSYRLRASRWFNMSEPNVVKQALMNYGALAISYYHDDYYCNETSTGRYAYYQNAANSTNHAVALVGWDDDYSRNNFSSDCSPSSDGAWLVKNSWGKWWSGDGYFWISYEDFSIQDGLAVFFETEMGKDVPSSYNLYQYDGSGANWRYTKIAETIYASNVYQAVSNNERLSDVGFVIGQAETQYTIDVYKDVIDTPTSGTLVHTQSGKLSDAGYYLINLNKQIDLSEGEKFAIVVKQSSPNKIDLYIDGDSVSRWTYYGDDTVYYAEMRNDTENDISYYSYDGSYWYSLTTDGETARIKAVTIEKEPNNAPTITTAKNYGSGVLVEWDEVPGATGYVVYRRAWDKKINDWTTFARWNNTKELKFLDTKVYEGTKYQYGIKAYYGDDPRRQLS